MKTYTRAYDNYDQAQRAVGDLEKIGIPGSDISLVANKYVSEDYADVDDVSAASYGAGIGATLGGGAGLLAGLGLMAIPGLGPVVAVGWLASTLVGAAAGSVTGGIIGALVDGGTSEGDAHVYSEAVRRGGTLVTVRTELQSDKIDAVLDGYRPIDPNTRRTEYEKSGWSGFDPEAPAYRPDESEVERARRKYG